MFVLIYLLLTKTRVGIVVRSAIYKPRMVEALGHNVPMVFMGVFAVGAGLAGLAGAVAGAFYTTNPNMALELGVLVFVVVVVGGLGRSEEHTSELQSLMRISYAVFCLKKNK